jgi:hypothetical protein
MTRSTASRLTLAALTATALSLSTGALAYGVAAPMGVSGIEAQAPVTSLNATAVAASVANPPKAATRPASRLRAWIAALRLRVDGAIEVALR